MTINANHKSRFDRCPISFLGVPFSLGGLEDTQLLRQMEEQLVTPCGEGTWSCN